MSLVSLEKLSADAKAWVFGSAVPFGERESTIRATMERFVHEWTAHGSDLPAGFDLVEDRFLIVGADEGAQPGGCSIDRLFKLMRAFETELGLPMLDSTLVFFLDAAGSVRSASRAEFRELATAGEVSGETEVFDTSIDVVAAYRDGSWRRPAAESWHGPAFGLSVSAAAS